MHSGRTHQIRLFPSVDWPDLPSGHLYTFLVAELMRERGSSHMLRIKATHHPPNKGFCDLWQHEGQNAGHRTDGVTCTHQFSNHSDNHSLIFLRLSDSTPSLTTCWTLFCIRSHSGRSRLSQKTDSEIYD